VRSIEEALRDSGAPFGSGGPFDRFDLEVRGGGFGGVRVIAAVEEHGAGRQLVRIRYWPSWSIRWLALIALAALSAWAAAADDAPGAALAFVAIAIALLFRAAADAGAAGAAVRQAIEARVGSVGVVLTARKTDG
jgi:O-antigen biosynthesis protein